MKIFSRITRIFTRHDSTNALANAAKAANATKGTATTAAKNASIFTSESVFSDFMGKLLKEECPRRVNLSDYPLKNVKV